MLTDILKVFHDFCEKHSLVYYAIGGTALGAARHQGFIPWDDDIDVGMPRPDYEKFIEIFNKENKEKRYILETPYQNDPCYCISFIKLYDTKTTLIENNRFPLKRGIYLDIFPLDGLKTKNGQKPKTPFKIRFLSYFRTLVTVKPVKERMFFKNFLLSSTYGLSKILNLKGNDIAKMLDARCKQDDYQTSDYVANFMGYTGDREIVPKSFFGTPKLFPFMGISLFCPEKTDEYLTSIFGDWRTPPPKEKQITHHSYFLDLTKSYLE